MYIEMRIGPIVRINPEELHVRDPDWYDELMTTSIRRPRDKTAAFAGRTGKNSIFGTVPHDLHRVRRAPVNPFFSKKSISAIEPLIQEKVDLLCTALGEYAPDGSDGQRAGKEIELGLAYMSLTLDIISHYAFGKSYGLLSLPGFSQLWKDVIEQTMESFALVRNLPWLPELLKKLPMPITRMLDKGIAFYLQMEAETRAEVVRIVRGEKRSEKNIEQPTTGHRNIFEELYASNLPPQEKTIDRLNEEGFTMILAGADTSTTTLMRLSYNLLSNPDILKTLKEELRVAIPDTQVPMRWQELENLPFLVSPPLLECVIVGHEGLADQRQRACIMESLRVDAVATARSVRAAPSETLRYKEWVIEPGTAVGMTPHFTHRSSEIYPEATKFDPYRWLRAEKEGTKANLEKYLNPFGKGSRSCVGLKCVAHLLSFSAFSFPPFRPD